MLSKIPVADYSCGLCGKIIVLSCVGQMESEGKL
jgi:hypothetical protein